MSLNKKQKKQLDVARKKLTKLQQLLTAVKQQTDEPAEVTSLQDEIAGVETQIEKIKNA